MSKTEDPTPVPSITGAPVSLTEDSEDRFVRYAWSMGIRTVSVLAFMFIDHWTRWIFLPAGLLLPYVAVVIANAGRENGRGRPQGTGAFVTTSGATPVEAIRPAELRAGRDVIDGEVVRENTAPQAAPFNHSDAVRDSADQNSSTAHHQPGQ